MLKQKEFYLFKKYSLRILIGLFLIWFVFFSLPSKLFDDPKSLVLYDRNGKLLYASVASDEQWRFPKIDSVHEKVELCVLNYEDEYFYYHPGINPFSIVKSFILNLKSNDIKRGGSTITMQTIRILLDNPPRTYWNKLREIILSIRLELFNSKKTILEYYVSNAPYGGNIVGIEAAAWRYFGKSSNLLSWGEAATLAVLPNQPSYIYPGKNQQLLVKKRNALLKKLKEEGIISEVDEQLASLETLPTQLYPIPSYAYHLATEIDGTQLQSIVQTTLDIGIQKKTMEILEMYHQVYKTNFIQNLAAIVIDAKTGEVLSYVGNTRDTVEGYRINMITKPRSSGSTLKPFLYANMLDKGDLTPTTLLQDIPIDINGYEPNNSSYHFDGLVPANQALVRSLNIPWILALKKYGFDDFYQKLGEYGFQHFTKSAKHYGLSLVVGGGEVELQELADAFLLLSNKLSNQNEGLISNFIQNKPRHIKDDLNLSRGALWLTFDALSNVTRPENEENWQYRQSQKLAWKTGTSHGFRDAWAVGANPNYVIAVWVGNSEGNGRTNLTGVKKAAPILFDILNSLPIKQKLWYSKPFDDLKRVLVCKSSGYLPNEFCSETIETELPKTANPKEKCPYHTPIYLDSSQQYTVYLGCYPEDKTVKKNWFKLPIVEESYYRVVNPLYQTLPPIHPNCLQTDIQNMELIFPKPNAKIVMHGSQIGNQIILQAIHRTDSARIHWFLDNHFLTTTQTEHKVSIEATQGTHQLTIQDNYGNFKSSRFQVVKQTSP